MLSRILAIAAAPNNDVLLPFATADTSPQILQTAGLAKLPPNKRLSRATSKRRHGTDTPPKPTTYAQATNLAAEYPEHAASILSSPLGRDSSGGVPKTYAAATNLAAQQPERAAEILTTPLVGTGSNSTPKTYAAATNLAVRNPERAAEILSTPLASNRHATEGDRSETSRLVPTDARGLLTGTPRVREPLGLSAARNDQLVTPAKKSTIPRFKGIPGSSRRRLQNTNKGVSPAGGGENQPPCSFESPIRARDVPVRRRLAKERLGIPWDAQELPSPLRSFTVALAPNTGNQADEEDLHAETSAPASIDSGSVPARRDASAIGGGLRDNVDIRVGQSNGSTEDKSGDVERVSMQDHPETEKCSSQPQYNPSEAEVGGSPQPSAVPEDLRTIVSATCQLRPLIAFIDRVGANEDVSSSSGTSRDKCDGDAVRQLRASEVETVEHGPRSNGASLVPQAMPSSPPILMQPGPLSSTPTLVKQVSSPSATTANNASARADHGSIAFETPVRMAAPFVSYPVEPKPSIPATSPGSPSPAPPNSDPTFVTSLPLVGPSRVKNPVRPNSASRVSTSSSSARAAPSSSMQIFIAGRRSAYELASEFAAVRERQTADLPAARSQRQQNVFAGAGRGPRPRMGQYGILPPCAVPTPLRLRQQRSSMGSVIFETAMGSDAQAADALETSEGGELVGYVEVGPWWKARGTRV
ncbi:hypothetical protein K488DRAFT_82498 [Vararia minispora EC-137]|uniref:Uncharacterized protein n=1 Tax=Vararia minispora EC-137 TaxID=1314806 RepID=A0ACB8QWN0_9AGAM|nr:hypothetical protein K488DRAFT_82498 [Vararia minispora EC-137]